MDRRSEKRSIIPLGLVPGKLLIESNGREPQYVPIEVGSRGFGAIILEPLPEGEHLVLRSGASDLRLTIKRMQSIGARVWRCWVEADDPQANVHELFESGGCLNLFGTSEATE